MWHRDGGARKGLGVSLSRDDRAGSPGRPRWTELSCREESCTKGASWPPDRLLGSGQSPEPSQPPFMAGRFSLSSRFLAVSPKGLLPSHL